MEFSRKDIAGVVFFVLAVFAGLSVYSYSASDPSFNTAVNVVSERAQNLLGLMGSYSSDLLIQLFGLSSLVLPVALLLTSIFIFYRSGKQGWFSYLRATAFISLMVCLSISMEIIVGEVSYGGNTFSAGGFVGRHLCLLVEPYLSNIGTGVLFITTSLLLLFYLANYSFASGMAVFVFWLYKVLCVISKVLYKIGRKLYALIISRTDKKELPEKELALLKQAEKLKVNINEDNKKISSKQKALVIADIDDDDEEEAFKATKIKSGKYKLPSVELLNKPPKGKSTEDLSGLEVIAKSLEARLKDFGVEGKVVEVSPGPVITMYEFKPAPGVKINKVANLSDDLALALGCGSLRVIAPIPGKSVIGIEVPNKIRDNVYIRELIDSNIFRNSDKKIPIAVGKDTIGNPYMADLAKMPHLLVAGSTGSGKSVFINSLICSILYKFSPQEVRMIMVDPKMLELSIYEGIPHLLHPVVTEAGKASQALKWAVREMMSRYAMLSEKGAKSISSYNATSDTPLPYIIIIVDELADLMMVSSKDVEASLTRLAQMARAAGIHLVLATQRPSVDVITGLIKANFPARIAFKVASKIDSRTILDTMGADKLIGNGDMLFLPPGSPNMERLHGAFVSDEEVGKIVDFVKSQGAPNYRQEIVLEDKKDSMEDSDEEDELYDEAVRIVQETRKASISYIQRRLKVGYNRAASIVELMEKNGVVSGELGSGRREVLID